MEVTRYKFTVVALKEKEIQRDFILHPRKTQPGKYHESSNVFSLQSVAATAALLG